MDKVYIATNNGDIGGGEIMLLNIARALRSLGTSVVIISPSYPRDLLEAAQSEGFKTLALPANNRKTYIAQLRLWRFNNRQDVLWCNGLVPSFATANLGPRIVHIHQLPKRSQKLAYIWACRGSLVTLVPSGFIADKLPGTEVLHNWVTEVTPRPANRCSAKPTISVGYLGRISESKGTDLLAEAIYNLNHCQSEIHFNLVIGGEYRFVDYDTQNHINNALKKLGDSLSILGWTEPQDFFEKVDCIVMPSQGDEAFGLVAAETMSARKPLIVTNSGALPSIVGESYPWIAERGSVHSISEMLLEMAYEIKNQSDRLDKTLNDSYWRWHQYYSQEVGKSNLYKILRRFD